MAVWHEPVLAGAVLEWLQIQPDGTYVDATVGTGGHALGIARRLTTGRLVGIDRDAQALEQARERLKDFERRVTLVQANFSQIDDVRRELRLPPVDGLVADLGVSTLQLDTAERGFSFRQSAPLDMRMDRTGPLTADEIVNQWRERELADLLFHQGEEYDARRIARAIVRARPIRDTEHLATVVAGARKAKGRQKLHPATKTFLALRIAVNREMEELEQFLLRAPATLAERGRWVMLSYHSLEDRQVKQAFRRLAQAGEVELLTRKPIMPTADEIESNPRARSARMRAVEKIGAGCPQEQEKWSNSIP
ncbi:MAG TPA: 16S rRNA (cytosine(1402)-N(4))-methyltransferase RsmH [Candidatus Dormibacteraeota bacterium]|nr:16S rRNA (cytosine(1402)-N(4))-methyltransferase RsmH [Candidatus Dormibacteraeota bacterium]